MIERACRLRGHPLGVGDLPPLLERFIAHYTDNMPGDTQPYPGLVAAMDPEGGGLRPRRLHQQAGKARR